MLRQLSEVSTITIHASKVVVLLVVHDIKSIERFEVKADHVNVRPIDGRKGTYTVRGHFAGVLDIHSVVARHLFHYVPLIAVEHAQLASDTARRQVRDDAVAHAGRGIVQRGLLEQLQHL